MAQGPGVTRKKITLWANNSRYPKFNFMIFLHSYDWNSTVLNNNINLIDFSID